MDYETADTFRPRTWDDYVGQEGIKRRLDVIVEAANARDAPIDHVLLLGPPGSGKSTLASLIAQRLDDEILEVQLPVKNTDQFCEALEDACCSVVLLDELHNASRSFQELLQYALYDGVVVTPDGYRLDVSHLTFIGATTTENRSKLFDPLVQRFPLRYTWMPYTEHEMSEIVRRMARRVEVQLPGAVADGLARAAGGTPRHVEELVKRARDLADTNRPLTVETILDLAGLDEDGLTVEHLEYLRVLRDLNNVAGLKTLTNVMQTSAAAIENLERLLVIRGFIRFSGQGRRLTATGRAKVSMRTSA